MGAVMGEGGPRGTGGATTRAYPRPPPVRWGHPASPAPAGRGYGVRVSRARAWTPAPSAGWVSSLGPLALLHAVVVLASAAGLLAITAADRGCPADAGTGPAMAAVVLAWTLLTAGGGGVALVAALLVAFAVRRASRLVGPGAGGRAGRAGARRPDVECARGALHGLTRPPRGRSWRPWAPRVADAAQGVQPGTRLTSRTYVAVPASTPSVPLPRRR